MFLCVLIFEFLTPKYSEEISIYIIVISIRKVIIYTLLLKFMRKLESEKIMLKLFNEFLI